MTNDNSKAPGQIFRWFEKMKANYEKNLASMMERFERNVDKQNLRIDNQNSAHIEELKGNYKQQLNDKNQTIEHLNSEIVFYKQQVSKQQGMLEQLNGRYDAIMHALLSEKRQSSNLKDLMNDDENQTNVDTESLNTSQTSQEQLAQQPLNSTSIDETSSTEDIVNQENMYDIAMDLRQNGEQERAFIIFEKAAQNGDTKSMGALARAYFLNEGVDENQLLGLSWLITAANSGYEPAIKKCENFKRNSPELYEQSLALVEKR